LVKFSFASLCVMITTCRSGSSTDAVQGVSSLAPLLAWEPAKDAAR
jgi:hypothetical protein